MADENSSDEAILEMRIKGVIAYDGSFFEGFQRQRRTENTVTQHFEKALLSVGISSRITGSGRTDAGVHATGQVIHFDLPSYWQNQSLDKLRSHLNAKLDAIRVKHLCRAPSDFHARYDAKERIYRYVARTDEGSLFERNYTARLPIGDWDKMHEALHAFVGTHDFRLLMKSGSDTRTFVRTVRRAYVIRDPRGRHFRIYFHADGFLRAQVRMMIHAAVAVSRGKITLDMLQEQIDAKRRYVTGLAPPQGLYLARVLYGRPRPRSSLIFENAPS